jgi:cobalamin-dependent methionine synthase I/methionine synthase I (cobalamin-dependent)
MAGSRYLEELGRRVLVYDGAMGTSIQGLGLTAEDFGGPTLEGCNDYLVITRPDVIEAIHASFLEVGCDVVETDTFRSNRLTLGEYGLGDRVLEINRAAAEVARRACARFATEDRPRFVAGSIGPSGFLPSTSDPALGAMTYEELEDVFAEQARGLVEGGVDVLLIETSQDLLEVKAQVAGLRRALRELGRDDVAIQAQVTLDTSGRMLLGTDIAAAATVLEALRVDVIGLNCSTGPEHMREPVRWLAENCALPISVIPNAGIPHNEGGVAVYPLEPGPLAEAHASFVSELGVSIVGGCCGTTPAHMAAVVERVRGASPKPRPVKAVPRVASAMTAYDMAQIPAPTLIGERVNTQGSRAVKRMLLADDYDGVRDVARGQVDGGAHLLDVCVALTERPDEAAQMRALVKLLAQSVETPLVIDTTEADVVEAALRQYPGRAIINSINLEAGRDRIDTVVPMAVQHGAALVALTIDETGMAKTADRKVEIARRIHDIVVGEYGMDPADLIFDDLTFTLATGEAEFRRSAMETMDGIRRIKAELPGVLTSLGVSNVSFGLKPHARAVLNSVFLHHCVEAGLDMAIVNPAHITPYAEVDAEQRQLADDLIFDTRDDALQRFIEFYEEHTPEEEAAGDPREAMPVDDAIHWSILHRKKEGVVELVDAAIGERVRGSAPLRGFSAPADAGFSAPADAGFSAPADARFSAPADARFSAPADAGFSAPADAGFSALGPADLAFRGGGSDTGAGEGTHEESTATPKSERERAPKASASERPTAEPEAERPNSVPGGERVPSPESHRAGVHLLNHVLLPAMKEVGDKFGAGELILPFVLQSAEVMKAAVGRMETYLEKVEGQSKGTVVLATVFGDVHDIGKNLVHTILENNGYTVHDLGKQVPVNDIIARAEEVNADVIGLSALLVSTSKQMPIAVKELEQRGLRFPVMCGGAAINPSFIRGAAFVDEAQTALYEPGVWYCKDAFEGLAVVDALRGDDRESFVRRRHEEIRAGVAKRAALLEKAKEMRPADRPGPSRDVAVPEPEFLGVKVIDRIPLAELYELIDLNTLYRLHWGAKNAKGEEWERLVRDEFEPRLERMKREALAGGQVRVRAAYGFWPAAADGNDVVVYDPEDPAREIERFPFPRQSDRERLCLADYLRAASTATSTSTSTSDGPGELVVAVGVGSGGGVAPGTGTPTVASKSKSKSSFDYVGFIIVSVSDRLLERSEAMMKGGEYTEGYYLHGFGVRLAEAAAEWTHRRMRREWGIAEGRGLRYAWGYPACPDHMQHEAVFRLLPAREKLAMELTSAGALVPELSTAAIVFHHPEAKYFSAV